MKMKTFACAMAGLLLGMTAGTAGASTVLYSVNQNIGVNGFTDVDVNQDGTTDISLGEVLFDGRRRYVSYTNAYGRNGTTFTTSNALSQGQSVDETVDFAPAVNLTGSYRLRRWGSGTFGLWDDGTTNSQIGFLGITLGTGQYGWLQLALNPLGSGRGSVGQILAFGYETEAGVGILAGAGLSPSSGASGPTQIIPNPLPASAWLLGGALIGVGAAGRLKKRKS